MSATMPARRAFLLLALAAGLAAGDVFPPPDAEDLREFPPDPHPAGEPPASGLRHWQGFTLTSLTGAYASVTVRDGATELWANTWGDGGPETRALEARRGPDLDHLGPPSAVLDARQVLDVTGADGAPAPRRGLTRPSVLLDPQQGYVLLACVCPDYLPGQVPLLPALATSRDGAAGSWRYLGRLAGEPATTAAAQRIWSDGGSVVRLADRWRVYLNGFGQALCAAEAADLAGPWTFLRDAQGGIRELLPEFRRLVGRTGTFPVVLRAGPADWHAWLCDGWPTQAIWHWWSADGLDWRPYGAQPEITRALVGGRPLKCLRPWLDGDGIGGLLSVWMPTADGGREWRLMRGRLPAGPPP